MDSNQEKFEFDAPQFVDFQKFMDGEIEEDDNPDSWFDQHTEDDDFRHAPFYRHSDPNNENVAPPQSSASNAKSAVSSKPVRANRSCSNLPARSACPSPKKSARLATAASQPCSSGSPSQNTRSHSRLAQEKTLAGNSGAARPATKNTNTAAGKQGARPNTSVAKTTNLHRLGPAGAAGVSQSTPTLNSVGHSRVLKSTIELELEKIAAKKAQVAQTMQASQESYQRVYMNKSHVPLRSNKPVTLPQAFHFSTDKRIKRSAPQSTPTLGSDVKDFTATLRDSKAVSKPLPHHTTRPKPFKFSENKKPLPVVAKYESDAEKVANFSKKTPQRFKSKPRTQPARGNSCEKLRGTSSERRQSPRLTVPQSPALKARGRSRPVHAISREEQERIEFEKHQKEQFKAHGVNHKILQMPVGIQPPPPRPLTDFEEFSLTRRRSMSTGDLQAALIAVEEEEHRRFKAKPVDRRILSGTLGVKPAERLPCTVPESPAFALKNRVRLHKEPEQAKEEPEHVARTKRNHHHIKPMGVPFKPTLQHKYTVPQPFEVEHRSKEMLSHRQQKIDKVLEEERKAHEFTASVLWSFEPGTLPPKQTRPLTQPEPFDLAIDKRGQEYQHQFKRKLEEERRLELEAAQFKAAPCNVTAKKGFQPQHSTKPLTEMDKFQLNTDSRAANREQYNQQIKEKEANIAAMKRQQEERRKREEQEEVVRLRREAVHQAKAIKKYKPLVIQPSDIPLTETHSPNFSTKRHMRRGSH